MLWFRRQDSSGKLLRTLWQTRLRRTHCTSPDKPHLRMHVYQWALGLLGTGLHFPVQTHWYGFLFQLLSGVELLVVRSVGSGVFSCLADYPAEVRAVNGLVWGWLLGWMHVVGGFVLWFLRQTGPFFFSPFFFNNPESSDVICRRKEVTPPKPKLLGSCVSKMSHLQVHITTDARPFSFPFHKGFCAADSSYKSHHIPS